MKTWSQVRGDKLVANLRDNFALLLFASTAGPVAKECGVPKSKRTEFAMEAWKRLEENERNEMRKIADQWLDVAGPIIASLLAEGGE